jgi:hypothetical protein
MADRQLVLAVFPDEVAADSAAVSLKDSGIADGDAIGILALDSDGKLKQDKVGAHSTGKGAAIGGVIAAYGRRLRDANSGRHRNTRAGEVPLAVKPGRHPARAGDHPGYPPHRIRRRGQRRCQPASPRR